jgi:uncharacterized protein
MDGGAALAFMIGGPVTAIPTMVLFWTFFKKRVFFLYMFVCLSGTILIAYASQAFIFVPGIDLGNPLLKGVASLSGGESGVLSKVGPNVRMVMDPGGKGIIATCTDDIDGLGGIVIDASAARFNGSVKAHSDDPRYVTNIAAWLDQNSSTPAQKKILLYDLDPVKGGVAGSPLADAQATALAAKGYTIKGAARSDMPSITPAILSGYGEVWLFFGRGRGKGLTDGEMKALAEYNAGGGAMLIVAPDAAAGVKEVQEANLLTSRFGVDISGEVENGEVLHVSAADSLLSRWSVLLGRILKLTHKA